MGPPKTPDMEFIQEQQVPRKWQSLQEEQAFQDWELYPGVDDGATYFIHDEPIEDIFDGLLPLPELLIDSSELEESAENDSLSPWHETSVAFFPIDEISANYVAEVGKVLEKAELEALSPEPHENCFNIEANIMQSDPFLVSEPNNYDFGMEFNNYPNEPKCIKEDAEEDEEKDQDKVLDELKTSNLLNGYNYRNASLSPERSSVTSYDFSDNILYDPNLSDPEPMESFEMSVTNSSNSSEYMSEDVAVNESNKSHLSNVRNCRIASLSSEVSSMTSDLSSDDTNDPDWPSTEFMKKETKATVERKTRKPYKKIKSAVERRERKKEQNRHAATRYRIKKRESQSALLKEEQELLEKREKLQKDFDALKTENDNIKRLWRELQINNGSIKKVSGKWVWA